MSLNGKQVTILGAGIAGLAAAEHLASRGVAVTLVERSLAPGGHAAGFSCKAGDACVRCGACMVQDKLANIARFENLSILTGVQVKKIFRDNGFRITCETHAGVGKGKDGSVPGTLNSTAVLVTTGFKAYDPTEKPYGYGIFPDVITNLDAEGILKTHGKLKRPSDGRAPEQLAFIQCVGSRDSRIHHPWCSKICCGSALRMARLIQHRQPDTQVTFFYIDVQTFGKNFQAFYDQTQNRVQMVRAIPGDIFKTPDNRLQATFFDPQTQKSAEATFDMVILSVGLTPCAENAELARLLDWPLTSWGFLSPHRDTDANGDKGVFTAGAALGPMSIPESIDSAGRAAWDIAQFLER